MIPRVADLSHHNSIVDLRESVAAGLWGVIHKATEGTGYVDARYATRREGAAVAELLWGAYHFNTGADVAAQVDHFVKTAAPDDKTLMALDFEDHPADNNMTIQQAVEFMKRLEQKIGRECVIYSGNRLKETLKQLNSADGAYITSRRLWLAQYGPNAVLPKGFTSWWLWQYTGDDVGLEPHSIAGIAGTGIDLNAYSKTQEELRSEWPGKSLTKESEMVDTPVVTTVQMHDPIPEIIAGLEAIKKFMPIIAGLPIPAVWKVGITEAIPVIEEVLMLIEAFKNKSGVDLIQTIGQHIQTIGNQVQTVTAVVAPLKSEGMPNAQ